MKIVFQDDEGRIWAFKTLPALLPDCTGNCDADNTQFCKETCAGKGSKALCQFLYTHATGSTTGRGVFKELK